jgi:O-antigen/teichoic acid export membrane protein
VSPNLLFASELLDLQVAPERWRIWGIRGAISILDQGLTSGAGFLVNLLLARWLVSEAYGAFAVAFAALLFLFGFHSALLLEPMSVVGPSSYADRINAYFVSQLKLHAALATVLSAILLLATAIMAQIGMHRELVLATLGSGLALPFILLLWLVRRMCYVAHRPSMAAWGSAGYLAFVATGLFLLRATNWLNPFSAFILMGAGSIPAVLLLFWQLGLFEETTSSSCSWRLVLQENWQYGRWIVASTVLFSVVAQTQTYLTAAFLGLGATGIFRAVQIPSLAMTQIVTAVGLLVLPTMASDFGVGSIRGLKRKAVLSTALLTTLSLIYVLALTILASPIEHLLFGGKFSGYAWLIPVLGLVPVCTGFAMGFSMAVRACQKPHYDLIANAVSAPIALISAFVCIKSWGLAGAALSCVAGFGAYGLVYLWSFRTCTLQVEGF